MTLMKTKSLPRNLLLLAIATVAFAVPSQAKEMPRGEDVIDVPAISDGLWVSNTFQSNMVLQRDKTIAVWGWAEPGEKVTASFAGNTASATAGTDRRGSLNCRPGPPTRRLSR